MKEQASEWLYQGRPFLRQEHPYAHSIAYCMVFHVPDSKIKNFFYIGSKHIYAMDWFDYFGSGTIPKQLIRQYGVQSCTRHIVWIARSRHEAYAYEDYLHHSWNVVHDDRFINLIQGVPGFSTPIQHPIMHEILSRAQRNRTNYNRSSNAKKGIFVLMQTGEQRWYKSNKAARLSLGCSHPCISNYVNDRRGIESGKYQFGISAIRYMSEEEMAVCNEAGMWYDDPFEKMMAVMEEPK